MSRGPSYQPASPPATSSAGSLHAATEARKLIDASHCFYKIRDQAGSGHIEKTPMRIRGKKELLRQEHTEKWGRPRLRERVGCHKSTARCSTEPDATSSAACRVSSDDAYQSGRTGKRRKTPCTQETGKTSFISPVSDGSHNYIHLPSRLRLAICCTAGPRIKTRAAREHWMEYANRRRSDWITSVLAMRQLLGGVFRAVQLFDRRNGLYF